MSKYIEQTLLATLVGMLSVSVTGCATPDKQVAGPGEKTRITRLDDLPQHSYPITEKPSELLGSRERILELADAVARDVQADLDTYEITDNSTLQRMYGTLLTVDLLHERFDSVLARIEQIRVLEDKESAKQTTGLTTLAMIDARRAVGAGSGDTAYRQAFRRSLSERAGKLPWDIVQDDIQSTKGRMEILSPNLIMGAVQAQIDPVVENTGELSGEQASAVVSMYVTLNERIPLKDETIGALQEIIDANKTAKTDIWADRSATLAGDPDLSPVLMGVWDSGTDVDVFSDRLFVNRNERPDGRDSDNNGFVDDVHGIAYDIHAQRTTGLICPLEDAAGRIDNVMKHMKGFMDLQAAVDSPEASELKHHLASLDQADVKGFIEDLGLAGNYAHGTHVAGIMQEGNPAARLLIARLSYDHRMKPVARTIEWARRDAAKCRDTVEYFKQQGVRVVNMSWGERRQDAEDSLERNGIGESAEQRRELARQVFELQRAGLYEAIKNAPDVLFVAAAGNADNDVRFDEDIPSSFDLPNLLVVGAVDQAGEPTSFTSFGQTVQVYANGFEVESYVPGGSRMKMSGTSMASPNVANLVGKILAVSPDLTPPQVIALITKGSDRKPSGDTSFLLINPKKTLNLLKAS